jgi:hypothetical protein
MVCPVFGIDCAIQSAAQPAAAAINARAVPLQVIDIVNS